MGFSRDPASGYEGFTHLHALFLASSVITYLADITLDVILAVTYALDGYYAYALVTVCLVLFPTIIVQIFSARWHVMDEVFDKATGIIHAAMLGVLHRYLVVISLGLEAMKTDDDVDYQRFYQQQSDVCMLRLFDSFLESAPQLVFHLYVMLRRNEEWSSEQAAWTALSALASMVSLGWGIAAYSSAMRMVRQEKSNLEWPGMILQTVWRFGMLAARVVALVLLTLTVDHWVVIILFVHWLVMTSWVVWQDTDFCSNVWEERLYNAVVGVVYCFCFFNLKEGNSRYRALLFYVVVIAENLACVALFACLSDFQDPASRQNLTLASLTIVITGTVVGLAAMLLYYRFFHPAGPINPFFSACSGVQEEDSNIDAKPDSSTEVNPSSPAAGSASLHRTPPPRPPRRTRVQYSRSFKESCPPASKRQTPRWKKREGDGRQPEEFGDAGSPATSNVSPRSAAATGDPAAADRLDSAYGTDSNGTTSPHPQIGDTVTNRSGSSLANRSTGSSSHAFNNETYMSIEDTSPERQPNNTYNSVNPDTTSDFSQCSADSRVTVIKRELYATPKKRSERQAEEKPLKRSPVVKDVTEAKRSAGGGLTAPLTIIIPNISHQAFARSNSSSRAKDFGGNRSRNSTPGKQSVHDYENLALVNINRARSGDSGAVSHWRTYSDMANGKHDESTAYEKRRQQQSAKGASSDYSNYSSLQYYDIYPLSREMKDKLYRSLTPVSTTAMVDSDSNTVVSDSDTYEPIETYALDGGGPAAAGQSTLPVTLIHHDGQNMMTKQILSLENLKEVLQNHQAVPMDDPQDRGDLYLLAPMRLLTPILEESEHDVTKNTESTAYQSVRQQQQQPPGYGLDLNRSILTIISEILNGSNNNGLENSTRESTVLDRTSQGDGFDHWTNLAGTTMIRQVCEEATTSSLVHTIEEVRNSSLCNLFFSSNNSDLSVKESGRPQPAPQVPSRSRSAASIVQAAASPLPQEVVSSPTCSAKFTRENVLNASVKSIKSNTLVPSPSSMRRGKSVPNIAVEQVREEEERPSLPAKKPAPAPLLSKIAGSRKNIVELAGDSANILNTPRRPPSKAPPPLSLGQTHQPLPPSPLAASTPPAALGLPLPGISPLASVSRGGHENASSNKNLTMSLSPSSKYETPTPPLRPNQFIRSYNATRLPRRKFSILRQRFEPAEDELQGMSNFASPGAASFGQDLYQNISNSDLLNNDLSEITGGGRSAPSTPSFLDSRKFDLRADEKYENLQRGWATSSTRQRNGLVRGERDRRSLSALENGNSPLQDPAVVVADDKENLKPPALGPKPRRAVAGPTQTASIRSSHLNTHRMSSLSPNSIIFNAKC